MTSGAGPLAGIRVVDASEGIAGAVAGMYLADAGAEVVRIPPHVDRWAPHPGALAWNRSKVRVDVRPDDPAARRLLGAADVVVVDGGAATLVRDGLDAAALREDGGPVVHLWLPVAAARGRWRDLAPDPWLQAAATGAAWQGDLPALQRSPLVAYQQALLGATAATAALVGRERSGAGASVEVSGLQAISALMVLTLVQGLREPTIIGVFPQFRVYHDRDGQPFALAALAAHFFLAALDALDLAELLLLPGLDGAYERLTLPEIGTEVGARLQAKFATDTAEHWVTLLRSAGVPCATLQTTGEWLDSDTVAAAGMKLVLDDPTLGRVTMPGLPVTFDRTPLAAPVLERTAPVSWERGSQEPARPPASDLPLRGLRIVEMGTFAVGTFGPMLLGSFGADVVKVEAPGGDPYRSVAMSFMAVNRGKRTVTLDLKGEDGRAGLLHLVGTADAVIENLRAGVAERLEVSGDVLCRHNRRLVHTKITGWGEHGPMAALPAFDLLLAAASGTLAADVATGQAHDIGTATLAAFATCAALLHRERGGPPAAGQRVTTSMANHSLMCQLESATTCDRVPLPADDVVLRPDGDGWFVATEAGSVPALRWADIWDAPWVAANAPWAEVEHADLGRCRVVRSFASFDGVHAELGPVLAESAPSYAGNVASQSAMAPPIASG